MKFPCGIEPCYKKKNRSIPRHAPFPFFADRRRPKENETDREAISSCFILLHPIEYAMFRTIESRCENTAKGETEFRVQKWKNRHETDISEDDQNNDSIHSNSHMRNEKDTWRIWWTLISNCNMNESRRRLQFYAWLIRSCRFAHKASRLYRRVNSNQKSGRFSLHRCFTVTATRYFSIIPIEW